MTTPNPEFRALELERALIVKSRLTFEVLYNQDQRNIEADAEVLERSYALTEDVREVFGGEWLLPAAGHSDHIYTMINFVMSRDAKISFAEEGYESARYINLGMREDLFLMGLARARCDAVMISDSTIRVEPQYWGTAEHIFPDAAMLFEEQRRSDHRREIPLQIVLSESGEIDPGAHILTGEGEGELEVLIVTGEYGEMSARKSVGSNSKVEVLSIGDRLVDMASLYDTLGKEYGIASIASEGGPYVYGSLLKDNLITEHLTCVSPILMGQDEGRRRPGLVEGFAYEPGGAPAARLNAVRRSGDFLFLSWKEGAPL